MDTKQLLQLKQELSSQVCIAAHHYQNRDIIDCADIVGDSYRLAVDAAQRKEQYIILCGVYFMAESAALFARDYQKILMPDRSAGCPMADMITAHQAETYLRTLQRVCCRKVVPVVYMNTNAPLKAVCGKYGGSVCTSSNASSIMDHYLSEDSALFFLPDQHLGANTALKSGLTSRDLQLLPRKEPDDHQINPDARLYLWDGYCPVHRKFSVSHIRALRSQYKDIRILVHPEVPSEIVQEADGSGSTEAIYSNILHAESGSIWGVGTESHFVDRVSREAAAQGKRVIPLVTSVCEDMGKTSTEALMHLLRLVQAGDEQALEAYHVTIDDTTAGDARKALETMITITENRNRQ